MTTYNHGDTSAWILLTTTYSALHGTKPNDVHNVFLRTDKQPTVDSMDDGVIDIRYPGRGHTGFTLLTEGVSVKIMNSYSVTKIKADEVIKGLRALQETDTVIKLRIQVTSSLFKSFSGDGSTTKIYMPVAIKAIKGDKKLYGGESTIYEIGMIQLTQIGDLSDS